MGVPAPGHAALCAACIFYASHSLLSYMHTSVSVLCFFQTTHAFLFIICFISFRLANKLAAKLSLAVVYSMGEGLEGRGAHFIKIMIL